MPLHLIQLTDQEWMDWNAVITTAKLLSINSKTGSYKGAIGNTAAGKALRADLTALVKASDKIVEVANSPQPEPDAGGNESAAETTAEPDDDPRNDEEDTGG